MCPSSSFDKEMSSSIGHCEDSVCFQSKEKVRLFRCSIHCNRNLCLLHLNAHNISYEEEKRINENLINGLQHQLSIYRSIFEEKLQLYRQLVHQASTILLNNSTTLIPSDEIRSITERIQYEISRNQNDPIVIKCESILSSTENQIETKETSPPKTKKRKRSSKNNDNEQLGQKVVLRFPRHVSSKDK